MLPEWASLDQVDEVSGQNNVLVPPPEKQQYGWDRLDFPPRNWFNWLGRLTYQWLKYFQQNDPQSTTLVIQGVYGTPYTIADTTTPGRLLMIYIQDSTQSKATDFFIGMCNPYSSTSSDRVVNVINSNDISVSSIANATGQITVSTADSGTNFTMVITQFLAG